MAKSQITPVYLDEYYTYDGMYQLTAFDRGELNSGHTGISGTPSREEDWTLDALGNWDGYVQKAGGTTSLDQARTVNLANEITGITETVGPAWPTPTYDRNGNSTRIQTPGPAGTFRTSSWMRAANCLLPRAAASFHVRNQVRGSHADGIAETKEHIDRRRLFVIL